ncbi:MAG: class II aldolase/adducin family protein [Candidatus Lariskella arthropodorum]
MVQSDNIIKRDLAYAYQIIAKLELDDRTYTHLSARSEDESGIMFMNKFGLRFSEIREENLLGITFSGEVTSGIEEHINTTGYILHGSIYKQRQDVKAVFHVHTPSIIAVSAMKCGILPISQWALHFYENVKYYDYDSLLLTNDQGTLLASALCDSNILMLRNHGVVICTKSIHEAMFFLYHLEKACKTQCLALGSGQELVMPSHELCVNSVSDLLTFEKDLGRRDFDAWIRNL